MISIPRILFGFHLVLIGCALLVWCGKEMRWYGREPVIAAFAVSVAAIFLVRPRFVLTADGLKFAVRIFYLFSFSYALIDRTRIRAIRVGWDREQVVGRRSGVAYSYIRPYLGIFLAFLWKKPPRETYMCLERHRDMDEARKKAGEYARVLGCPIHRN